MDFSLSDDQLLLRDTVRQFMEAELRPVVRQNDRDEIFPAEQVRKLGELGCCGMCVPEEWGGAGMSTVSYVVMLEEVARVCAATAVTLSVTNSVVAMPLYKHGSDAQREKYLRRLARGEIIGCFCLTEPAAGSDAAAIQARAVRAGNVYKLSGTKSWVSSAGQAGVYLVFAKVEDSSSLTTRHSPLATGSSPLATHHSPLAPADASAKAGRISAFLVEPSMPGFRISRYEDKMGLRSSRSAEIVLEDCEVPAENLLGAEGAGLKIALEALDSGRVGVAAQAVGIAQGALEESVRYAKQRRAFGKTIGEFQAIQWMLADMQTEIEAARALTHFAAWRQDQGASAKGKAASRAKLFASEMVNRVAYKAVQIHGAVGYSRETPVERMYRDARVLSIYEGTSEIQRMIIARDLLNP
ncbi:MAG: acyl-CoA dehydrogenase family protein [Acidobacteria bacterium]|nr:acyl-CoA dehydrogenase family protein [Acidobacteriota bacterium]MCL5288481.1 acyl-CoA dehydrogenase family protein [Acidobacteriota bacterium]